MGTLDTVQQEQLKAIGTYLSQIRQEQDRSLEDIAAKTYIPLRILKAIEAGQERPLPEPVFIQGFIRRYGDALGLDGIDLSQKFPVHVTPLPTVSTATSNRESHSLRNAYEPNYGNVQVEEREFSSQPQSPRRSGSLVPYIAAAAILALVGITFGIIKGISSREASSSDSAVVLPQQPVPSPTSSSSPSVSSSSEAASPRLASPAPVSPSPASPNSTASQPGAPSPSAQATTRTSTGVSPSPTTSSPGASSTSRPAVSTSPVNVAVSLSGDSWVQVLVDGEVKEEGVLRKGTQKSWAGSREITIVAGNAGAVSVVHNGSPAKVMGAAGDVEEMTFRK